MWKIRNIGKSWCPKYVVFKYLRRQTSIVIIKFCFLIFVDVCKKRLKIDVRNTISEKVVKRMSIINCNVEKMSLRRWIVAKIIYCNEKSKSWNFNFTIWICNKGNTPKSDAMVWENVGVGVVFVSCIIPRMVHRSQRPHNLFC